MSGNISNSSSLCVKQELSIAKKATKGAVALGARQVLVQVLNILGGVLLARLLSPTEFGLFAIVTFLLTFLGTFSGTGLAANLIRQPEEPGHADYSSIFTVQQLLILLITITLFLLSPIIASLYHLPKNEAWIFRLVALSILFTSFMVIPQVYLERHLDFQKLAVVEVGQAFVFNFCAVLLAWRGLGVLSFAIAILLRSMVGALLANLAHYWKISFLWDIQKIKNHICFGLPYLGGQFLNTLKDTINPIFIALFVGKYAVGYINWATMVANYPVLAIMLLNRLYMPAFAKFAHESNKLKEAINIVVSVMASIVFMLSIILYIYRVEITGLVFGTKWYPALILFLPFMIINLLLTPSIIAGPILNALGHVKETWNLSIMLCVSTWILGPIFVYIWGWPGWGWANVLVNLCYIYILYKVTVITGFNWIKSLKKPICLMIIVGIISYLPKLMNIPCKIEILIVLLISILMASIFLKNELVQLWQAFKS